MPHVSQSNTATMSSEATSRFDSYVSSVERMAAAAMRSTSVCEPSLPLSDLLDGHAGATLRETVPLAVRRQKGAFFSGASLRSAALTAWGDGFESGSVLDPAVGGGDLLIEVAKRLPVVQNLTQTLRRWGQLLHGRDVEPGFVRLAKARLVLLAIARGATTSSDTGEHLDDMLPEIKVGDGLDLLKDGWSGSHIVMNPPFTYGRASQGTGWATGRTSQAAMFLAAAVEGAQPGARLTAILPDVIRTGSRYERLRAIVGGRLHVSNTASYGQFDTWTDVDVFILRGVVAEGVPSPSSARWWRRTVGERLGDRFDVNVGPVVPHRDLETTPAYPYLHARAIPLGGDFDVSCATQRGFQKRIFSPPFVVVRRTSRPGDRSRGMGTMIVGARGALVENHLIVLKPKDGSRDACRRAIDLLDSTHARQWLDERIRCRHLTVQALREMPWLDL